MKEIAQHIFRSTLAAIDIPEMMDAKLDPHGSSLCVNGERIDLGEYREIVPIAYGKAALAMADGLDRIISPDSRAAGILVSPAPPSAPHHAPRNWEIFLGGHPVPNEQSLAAGRAILERLKRTDERSLIFFLLSGGGSSIVEQGLDPNVSLADFQQLHRALVNCGAPIEEINVIRRHLSATKGGRLAQAAPLAMKITLGVTDVPEGHEPALASGPTLPDPSTIADAFRIAENHRLIPNLPPVLRSCFDNKAPGRNAQARRSGVCAAHHFCSSSACTIFFITRISARRRRVFFASAIIPRTTGPSSAPRIFCSTNCETFQKEQGGKPVAVIADGEVSSPVTGDGTGGRNAAFVLACARRKSQGRKSRC